MFRYLRCWAAMTATDPNVTCPICLEPCPDALTSRRTWTWCCGHWAHMSCIAPVHTSQVQSIHLLTDEPIYSILEQRRTQQQHLSQIWCCSCPWEHLGRGEFALLTMNRKHRSKRWELSSGTCNSPDPPLLALCICLQKLA